MKLCGSKQQKLLYCCYFDGQRKTRRPRPPGWKGGSVSACFDDVGREGEYDGGRQKPHRGQNDPGKDHSHPRPPFAIRLNELSNSIRSAGPALNEGLSLISPPICSAGKSSSASNCSMASSWPSTMKSRQPSSRSADFTTDRPICSAHPG